MQLLEVGSDVDRLEIEVEAFEASRGIPGEKLKLVCKDAPR
jgi:hypothetical protein